MKILALLTMLMFVSLIYPLEAQTCSNSNLSGTYYYLLSGVIASGDTTLAYAELGKLIADGQGNVSGQSTASVGGSVSQYSLSGTYSVGNDCTGTLFLSGNSQPPASITFDIVEGGASVFVAFSSSGAVVVGEAYRTASQCGNGMFTGGYGYLLSGTTNTNVYSDAGRVLADGKGNLTVQSSVNLGAGATQGTATGSYSINADCSGTVQVTNVFGTATDLIALVEGGNVLFMSTVSGYTVWGIANPQSNQTVLPQFAFGQGWYSALYFSNSNSSPVSVTVNFTGDGGTPLTVPSLGGSSTVVNIAPNGTAVLEAPNTSSFSEGYASISLPAGVTGNGIFRQSIAGRADQEAVVPLSNANSTTSRLTWDEAGGAVTAVAIVNPSAVPTNVQITVWDNSGNTIGTSSVALQAKGKTAVTLDSLSGLSSMAGRKGSAQFTVSTGTVAVLGLRFSGVAFTSIPATQQ
jgi:hypothetical protein